MHFLTLFLPTFFMVHDYQVARKKIRFEDVRPEKDLEIIIFSKDFL